MKKYRLRQSPLIAVITGLLFVAGCGGGKDDPTKVTLKPSKEASKSGGSNSVVANAPAGGNQPTAKAGFGSIKGRIVIDPADKSNVPPPTVVKFDVGKAPVDPTVCARSTPIFNESLIVNPQGLGLKNVFFYLEKKPDGGKAEIASQSTSWPTADKTGEKLALALDQKNCTYVPHAMIVKAGQKFLAQSQDAVVHSYKGTSLKSGSFNEQIPPAPPGGEGEPVEVMPFKSPEKYPVPISCATHGWMSGYQLPLDHPYAAVTDADGNFTISDLPSGKHEFTIWHEKGNKIRGYKVDVVADETKDLGEITIRLNQLNKN